MVSTNPHSGTYNAKALPTSSSASFYCYETVNQSALYSRSYFYFTQMPSAADGNYLEVLRFMAGSTGLCGARISYTASVGQTYIRMFYRNNTSTVFVSNTGVTFTVNQWYCIEMYCLVASSTGAYAVWVDGASALTAAGVKSDAYGNVTQVRVGVQTSVLTTETPQVDWDDVVVADAYIGPSALTVSCSDVGAASDSCGLAAAVPTEESASGSESPTVNLQIYESAHGVEAAQPTLFFSESASGSEACQPVVSAD